jgi:hypothetical protein
MSEAQMNHQIRAVIKKLLKKNKTTYAALGKAIGLAEPTIKHLMTKGSFTVDRLELIAAWFGLSFLELMEMASHLKTDLTQLTLPQEKILAANPLALHLLLLLGAGLPLAEAAKRTEAGKQQVQKALHVLDKADLIELLPSNMVRVKQRGPYRLSRGGLLESTVFHAYLRNVMAQVMERFEATDLRFVSEMYLSQELMAKMRIEFQDLMARYFHLSRMETELKEPDSLFPVTGFVMLKAYDGWGATLKA